MTDDDTTNRDAEIAKLEKNLKTMQEKLLQVNKRNRSVQFKKVHSKHNFDLADLEDESTCQKIAERMLGKKTSVNMLKESQTGDDADERRAKLRRLSKNLDRIEEETGQQTGYVGFPFLQGHANPDFYLRGPLVLFPVKLEHRRQAKNGGWFLNFLDSPPIFNGALVSTIKKKANVEIPKDLEQKFDDILDDLAEYDGPGIEDYFLRRITEWAKGFARIDESQNDHALQKIPSLTKPQIEEMQHQPFRLTGYKVMGSFPQADNEIYRDYAKLEDLARTLDMGPLGNLLDIYDPADAESEPEDIDLDKTPDAELNTILDSDSSQDEVILRSKQSGLVVVRGPPGTGKSQVITNLIVDALSNRERVLVVCQKRAALEVVHQRLARINLDGFVVMLDKEHSDRKKMYEQLYATIQDPGQYRPDTSLTLDDVSGEIDAKTGILVNLGVALHKPYFGGATAQKLYCMSRGDYSPRLDLAGLGLEMEWNRLDGFIQRIKELEPLFKKFETPGHPWTGRAGFSGYGAADKSRIQAMLRKLIELASESTIASDKDLQKDLFEQFDTHIHNPGILKRNRKQAAKRISEILGEKEIDDKWVESRLKSVEKGIIFWDRLGRLLELFNENARRAFLQHNTQDYTGMFEMLEKSLADFEEMQRYDMKKENADSITMKLLQVCSQKLDHTEDWSDIIKKEVLSMWIDVIERENQILRIDPSKEHQRITEELVELFAKKQDILRNRIRSQIARTATSRDITGKADTPKKQRWKDFGAELKRKRKVKPVRQLFDTYTSNFLKIAPCWLASPESVSKIFPLKRNLFDLVIVDEASQLGVERALPFLYRARRVVIAGDEKQLQPFDLFQLREDEEAEYDEDVAAEKSLLDMAMIRHEPITLAWHYRSHYQDLINFSNHAFYKGMLQVAPNVITDPLYPPIRWVQCAGMWDDRHNHAEAKAVLNEMYKVWKKGSKTGDYPSVGVITFNDEQRDLIQEQFDKLADSNPGFYQMYVQAIEGKGIDDRPFFKNIENVQGDERDVIIFSIGYARGPDGKFANRFGTLGQAGGENRLNVAVTRARKEMVVVCSIDPGDIKETSKNPGPLRLRQFLEYSKATSASNETEVNNVLQKINDAMVVQDAQILATESLFEEQVMKELGRRGYDVRPQVGFSGYRIDLGIVHPDDPNRFVLGLECDGATFHSAKSARERDIMRQRFLEGKGWRIERIWSRNWWRNPEAEIERVVSRIKKEIESAPVEPRPDADKIVDVDIVGDSLEKTPDGNSILDRYSESVDDAEPEPKPEPKQNPGGLAGFEGVTIQEGDIRRYIESKDFGQNTSQSQGSILANFVKLGEIFPGDGYEQTFERFVVGKAQSSVDFSRSVISGFLKFLDDESKRISKEDAQKELAGLSGRLTAGEITREEYVQRRDELEKVLFD